MHKIAAKYGMVWYGMVNVDLYGATITKFSIRGNE